MFTQAQTTAVAAAARSTKYVSAPLAGRFGPASGQGAMLAALPQPRHQPGDCRDPVPPLGRRTPARFPPPPSALAAAVTAMQQTGQNSTVLRLDPAGLGSLSVHVASAERPA